MILQASTRLEGVELRYEGEYSQADPGVGWHAGFTIYKVWLASDPRKTDIYDLLRDTIRDMLADDGLRTAQETI
jgi:hypothetical protein